MERRLSSETKPNLTIHPPVLFSEQEAHENVKKSPLFCIGTRRKSQELNSCLQVLEDAGRHRNLQPEVHTSVFPWLWPSHHPRTTSKNDKIFNSDPIFPLRW
jgi:hypothetical protein